MNKRNKSYVTMLTDNLKQEKRNNACCINYNNNNTDNISSCNNIFIYKK